MHLKSCGPRKTRTNWAFQFSVVSHHDSKCSNVQGAGRQQRFPTPEEHVGLHLRGARLIADLGQDTNCGGERTYFCVCPCAGGRRGGRRRIFR
ncbi:hypothetical protein GN956_G24024 [Arapaima gigas]